MTCGACKGTGFAPAAPVIVDGRAFLHEEPCLACLMAKIPTPRQFGVRIGKPSPEFKHVARRIRRHNPEATRKSIRPISEPYFKF